MAVQHVWRYDHQSAAFDTMSTKLVCPVRRPGDADDGWIEPHGLVKHGARLDEAVNYGFWSLQLAFRFRPHPLLPFLRLRQQIDRPGQCRRCGFPSGEKEGENIR